MRGSCFLAIAAYVLCAASASAQSGGRDLPVGFRSVGRVTLNRDSAASIRAKLGPTRERRFGRGHDARVSWCYVSGGSQPRILEVMSDASDMGTPSRELNVIRLRDNTAASDREGCASLPASIALATPSGLQLGLSAARVERLLGRPTRRSADSLLYYFDAKEYLRQGTPEYKAWDTPEFSETCFNAGPPFANVTSSVIVILRGGRAAEIRIERYDQSVC